MVGNFCACAALEYPVGYNDYLVKAANFDDRHNLGLPEIVKPSVGDFDLSLRNATRKIGALTGKNAICMAGTLNVYGIWERGDRQPPDEVQHNKLTCPMPKHVPTPMPHNITPMLATLVAQPFDRAGWFFEIKWDGFRAIAEIEQGHVRLYSRNQISFENRFRPVFEALARLKRDVVLDGELVVLDDEGKSRFQLLQNYQRTGQGNLVFCIFDLLYMAGEDLRPLPLWRRKERLTTLLKRQPNILRLSEHIEDRGIDFFQAATQQSLEGIVAKNGASPYLDGVRSDNWLKIKARKQQEVVIAGFTEPRGHAAAWGRSFWASMRLTSSNMQATQARVSMRRACSSCANILINSCADAAPSGNRPRPMRRSSGSNPHKFARSLFKSGRQTASCGNRSFWACARTSLPDPWCEKSRKCSVRSVTSGCPRTPPTTPPARADRRA